MKLTGYRHTMDTHRDHASYINAVAAALREREIDTTEPRINAEDGQRQATMQISPRDEDHGFTSAVGLQLAWNESHGWTLTPHYPPDTGLGDVPWHHGLEVLPTPDAVAAWAYLLIMRPDVIPSYDLPASAGRATDLEAELAKYES